MLAADFDYELPKRLIAQRPLAGRSDSRMLAIDRRAGTWTDSMVADLPRFVGPGDCLVVNNSRVLPARLLGTRRDSPRQSGGGAAEILLLESDPKGAGLWRALVRPGKKLVPGTAVQVGDISVRIMDRLPDGVRLVEFPGMDSAAVELLMREHGHMPLPPYIRRADELADQERYQTVFARAGGSVAAPTAGLHFDGPLLERVQARGATLAEITLHVGLGTFRPLSSERVEDHTMHAERFEISRQAADSIQAAGRVVAVGTTAVRTLEAAAGTGGGAIRPLRDETDLFITPGFRFQAVGALLTNFHLPRSTLLMLVAAFAGTDLTRAAYAHAVEQEYRFYSYGDCMLVT
ncbi:MAG: tRNA preQ1(34) S-adenosylmethionine ribosyltransferase-isomerase QueA [Bryobacterales bacterium]|nr:tRNA preQ1(34) S-adenosylmethionine ribosyltransferase-isomerase QueA [Bryobacterales bacterium]MDE0620825.1 tRNA preQ1(34) S-adenosylmethionine ribosyltransferase-isomerase QueA [Bryobacterales bacterium]